MAGVPESTQVIVKPVAGTEAPAAGTVKETYAKALGINVSNVKASMLGGCKMSDLKQKELSIVRCEARRRC